MEKIIERIFEILGICLALFSLYKFTLFGYETGQYKVCTEAKYKQIKLESCNNEKGGE